MRRVRLVELRREVVNKAGRDVCSEGLLGYAGNQWWEEGRDRHYISYVEKRRSVYCHSAIETSYIPLPSSAAVLHVPENDTAYICSYSDIILYHRKAAKVLNIHSSTRALSHSLTLPRLPTSSPLIKVFRRKLLNIARVIIGIQQSRCLTVLLEFSQELRSMQAIGSNTPPSSSDLWLEAFAYGLSRYPAVVAFGTTDGARWQPLFLAAAVGEAYASALVVFVRRYPSGSRASLYGRGRICHRR